MFKDQIKYKNGLLLHIKLYWSININYPFGIVCSNPLENILWDLMWISDPLIYKMEDDITYIRSPIRSKVWNSNMRSYDDIHTREKDKK